MSNVIQTLLKTGLEHASVARGKPGTSGREVEGDASSPQHRRSPRQGWETCPKCASAL